MTTSKKFSETDIVTPDVRLSFPALFEPKPRARGSDKLTYQATLLLPPKTDMAPFVAAMKAAMMAKFGKLLPLAGRGNPIHKAEEKQYAGYEPGWHYISTNNTRAPAVVDQLKRPVTDPDRMYPGLWVRAFLNAYAWDNPAGGKGVSFSLNAIQVVRDGERLDGRREVNPDEVFTALEMPQDGAADAASWDPLA